MRTAPPTRRPAGTSRAWPATAYLYVSDTASAVSLDAALAELDHLPADVRVFQVEPGYVAGEETAAVNAINGRPAKPSEKPPRPFQEGVRGLPTLVSNAETIASLPAMALGTASRPPSFLMTLGSAVPRPGLYEVPFGIPLGEVTEVLGGLAGPARGYLTGRHPAAGPLERVPARARRVRHPRRRGQRRRLLAGRVPRRGAGAPPLPAVRRGGLPDDGQPVRAQPRLDHAPAPRRDSHAEAAL